MAEATQKPTYVVGIGASAGGLDALTAFFANMSADSGLAFVVIQHLSPDYRSMMPELLSRHTALPALRVEDGVTVRPNRIYLIPPKQDMAIKGGKLRLTEQSGTQLKLPIDVFLCSLARERRETAIGVVLSGTGSDGTQGVRALKEEGGMVMVQDPESARFDGMPRSALATGLADYVLDPARMPEELINFIRHPLTRHDSPSGLEISPERLREIFALIQRRSGIDFSSYKPNTILRRIERRMRTTQQESFESYLDYIHTHPGELDVLRREMLISVTTFFRDGEVFKALAERALPAILDNPSFDGTVRIWSVGCATGEEAYSVAMLMQEQLDNMRKPVDVKVFATDVDRDALDIAGAGIYPESIAADVSPDRLERFFIKQEESYQISRELRQILVFARHNVLRDPPFTRIDLVICRNLLIYMQPHVQQRILSLFHFALRPGGFMLLGSSETIGDLVQAFETVHTQSKIFRRRGTARLLPSGPTLHTPAPSAGGRADTILPGPVKGTPLLERFYRSLIDTYAATSLLIDARGTVHHAVGDPGSMLRFPAGEATLDILKLAPRSLAAIVGTAIQKVLRESVEVYYRNIVLDGEEESQVVDLRLQALDGVPGREDFLVLSLEKHDAPPRDSGAVTLADGQQLADLQRELQYTRENLQATNEELQTSNEELQATNEELLAANEELQSTNEELQATNEELHTVNAEYQRKIDELTELNADMDNLLRSTEVGTIFLDRALAIRKFTPAARELVNVMERDIGRPLAHLSHRLRTDTLVDDARAVLDSGRSVERATETDDGRELLIRVLPYQDSDDEVDGVVVTFVGITELSDAQRRLQEVIDTLPHQILVFDREGKVSMVNEAWLEACGTDNAANGHGHDGAKTTNLDCQLKTLPEPAKQALESVVSGERTRVRLRYEFDGRHFIMNAAPLGESDLLVSQTELEV